MHDCDLQFYPYVSPYTESGFLCSYHRSPGFALLPAFSTPANVLVAFTIPLPLFPRLIEWYTLREGEDTNGLLYKSLSKVSRLRGWFLSDVQESVRKRSDVVLLGVSLT